MNIITQQEVILLAFSNREDVSSVNIRPSSINIAQERYLASRLGYKLFDKICSNRLGDLYELTENYIKPALAHYVKYMLIDELLIQIDNRGCINFTGSNSLNTKNDSGTMQDTTSETGYSTSSVTTAVLTSMPGNSNVDTSETSQADSTDNQTTSNSGTIAHYYDTYTAAPSALIHKLQVRTLADANTLMSKAIRHIEDNEAKYGKFQGSARHYF